jgi:hypothetical protein
MNIGVTFAGTTCVLGVLSQGGHEHWGELSKGRVVQGRFKVVSGDEGAAGYTQVALLPDSARTPVPDSARTPGPVQPKKLGRKPDIPPNYLKKCINNCCIQIIGPIFANC